jgi:transglutaminase-like putative cysteine protease/tetratricopeptide (TPR) repeat protein
MSYFRKRRRHICATVLLVLFSAICAVGAYAQQAVEPWKVEHFSIDPKTLYDAATAVTATDGTNVVLLEDDETYSFDEAGRYTHIGYAVYKILTQQGAENWDSIYVSWEPWHEARPLIRARVIAPDLSVRTLDPQSISEAPAREGDYKTYSDGKRLHSPFPAIAPGVVVEEEYVERETVPFFALGRVGWITFGHEQAPVEHSHAVVEAPASTSLRTDSLLLNDMKPVRTEADGRVTLTFDIGRLESFEPREPNLPQDVARTPEVRFSTGSSWQAMAAEYGKITDSRAAPAAVQPVVDQLISGKKMATEKEEAIVDYLDREVRYTGIEFGESAIVPHDPAETLSHKYGDCKDKATLLVTMLRAAGIPAYVALLNAGSRMDVPANLPGMGLFDHAIVYVPGGNGPGDAALWIDATDRYARLGQLPINDQGRLALIARAETTAVVKTPESTSEGNLLLESRQFTLSENGPASVLEVTQPKGVFESRYRAYYADKPDKNMRENLRAYVKSQYVSEDLTKVERTDPADLSRQFELTLGCEKAKRGITDLDNAAVGIRVDALFNLLPGELKQKEETEEEKKKHGEDKPKTPRTVDWELAEPFITEWDYRIIPPAGFIPKEMPANARIAIGPALLTEDYSTDKDGAVLARLTFDTVKRRYTVDEATELRNKVTDIIDGPAILVNFEPQGAALLHEGKVKEALAAYRSMIALHPNEAVHHLQLAKVLLDAGMGEAARAEARKAVELEPNSALAEKTLAQILKFDLVGRSMRPGSDLAGAAEAYRAAIRLDPDDHTTQGDFAILLEYDPVGRRYGRFSKMKEAIAEYQKLSEDELTDLGIRNNLAYALFYGGDAEGAIKAAQTLNTQPTALLGASQAILHGSKAGLDEINKRSNGDDAFKESARTAGEMLMNIRNYPLAADFLEAGAAGDNAAQTMGLATMLRHAVHHEDVQFANSPTDLAKHAFLLTMDPDLTEDKLDALASHSALEMMKNEEPDEKKKDLEVGKQLNSQLARDDDSLDLEADLRLQAFDPKGDGDETVGYREKVQIPNGINATFFVVKEAGHYKLLGTSNNSESLALEMLDRIRAGNLNGAKVLLDWLREVRHLAGGDDPLGGPLFPRFWTKGEPADARKMKLARRLSWFSLSLPRSKA